MSSRLRLVALTAVLTVSTVASPAVAFATDAAAGGSGSHTVVATKKKSGKSTRPKKKPNPTPLWSLYPLTSKASPEPTPETETDALSTPPVKPTEQGAEPAAPASTGAAEEGGNGLPGSVVLAAVAGIVVLVLLLSVWVTRRGRRSRPRPVRPPTATSRATAGRARPAPARSGRAPSNGAVTAPPVTTAPARPAPTAVEAAPVAQAAAPLPATTESRPTAEPSPPRPAESGSKKPPASIDLREEPPVERREQGAVEPQDEVAVEARGRPEPGGEPSQAEVGNDTGRGRADTGDRVAAEPPVDREHVRVHLVDGRLIEGWRRGRYSRDNRVLVLDVERVLDAGGREIASTPLDSFLLSPQIDTIEPIGEPRPEASTGAVRGEVSGP